MGYVPPKPPPERHSPSTPPENTNVGSANYGGELTHGILCIVCWIKRWFHKAPVEQPKDYEGVQVKAGLWKDED